MLPQGRATRIKSSLSYGQEGKHDQVYQVSIPSIQLSACPRKKQYFLDGLIMGRHGCERVGVVGKKKIVFRRYNRNAFLNFLNISILRNVIK